MDELDDRKRVATYQQNHIPRGYIYQQHPSSPPRPRPQRNNDGYSSAPEPTRREHKNGTSRISKNSRSILIDGFIGAAGGGLIGYLLYPGLGAVGGTLAGWVAGKDYGKHRKWREERRDRDQERWERKYGSERSRTSSRDR
jgi:hypothetical protein